MGLSFICRSLLTVYPSVDVPLPRPRFSFHPAWSFILNPIIRRCNNVEGLTITIVSLRAVMNPSLHHPSLPPSIYLFIHSSRIPVVKPAVASWFFFRFFRQAESFQPHVKSYSDENQMCLGCWRLVCRRWNFNCLLFSKF